MALSPPAHPRVTLPVGRQALFLEVGRWAKQQSLNDPVRSFRPPARFAQFVFEGIRCLGHCSAQTRLASKLGPYPDREGSLVSASHRRDPRFRSLFKNGCGVLPAGMS